MSDFDEELKQLEQRNEEKAQNFLKEVSARIPLFIAIGIAVWWIFYGTVKVSASSLTLTDRIGLTVCTVVLAVTYCNLIAEGGFQSAEKSKDYLSTKNEYETAIRNGSAYKKEINEYAKDLARDNLKECRRQNLEANSINYNDIFNDDGTIKDKDYYKSKLYNRHQKSIIRRCMKLKIVLPNIFSPLSNGFFGITRNVSKNEFRTKNTIYKTIVRTIVSIVSVGLMFEFIGFSIGSMIYALFQIVLWTASGFSQRLKNYSFIIDNIIPQIQEKTLIINGYLAYRVNQKYNENNIKEKLEETQNV